MNIEQLTTMQYHKNVVDCVFLIKLCSFAAEKIKYLQDIKQDILQGKKLYKKNNLLWYLLIVCV